jgi:hypothetical protein
MTFLELCNKLKSDTGTPGTALSGVTGNGTELQRMIDWVVEAYRDICTKHDDWRFLRSSFTVNTVSGTQAYAPTSCTDTRISAAIGHATVGAFRAWIPSSFQIYLTSAGIGTEQRLPGPMDYDRFRDVYMLGSVPNQMPVVWTIRHDDDAILFGPTPDAIYTVTGDYRRQAPDLSAAGDSPVFDVAYHMAIVHLARRKHAEYWENGGMYDGASRAYNEIMARMTRKERPPITTGRSLA